MMVTITIMMVMTMMGLYLINTKNKQTQKLLQCKKNWMGKQVILDTRWLLLFRSVRLSFWVTRLFNKVFFCKRLKKNVHLFI